jgi:hypothetical protein
VGLTLRSFEQNIIINGDMTGNIVSDVIQLSGDHLAPVHVSETVCIQAVWSSGATGTLSLVASLNGINYDTISNSVVDVTGVSGTFLWDRYEKSSFKYIRLLYVADSGSGTLNALSNVIGYSNN